MSSKIQEMSSKIHVLENTAMSSKINTAGCPRKYRRCPRKYSGPRISSEIQQNVSEIQGMSSEIFTAGVLGNAENVLGNTPGCPRKWSGCPRKYYGMSSEIEWMSSQIHRMFSMTSEILFWGAQQLRTHLLDSDCFWDVLENTEMSSKMQKCLVFFHMSSKIQNPICPRN